MLENVRKWLCRGPPPLRPRGPLQLFLHFLLEIGIERMAEWHLLRFRGKQFSLIENLPPEILHIIRDALRYWLLSQLQHERPCFGDASQADIQATTRIVRKMRGGGMLSEVVTLLTNGLWTKNRLIHAGHVSDDLCPTCREVEDTQHVYWECPRWSRYREGLPDWLEGAARGSPLSAQCGVCLIAYEDRVKKAWPDVQQALARIIHAYQASMEHRICGAAQGTAEAEPHSPSHPGPPDLARVQERARPLDFTGKYSRHRLGTSWM